MTSPEMLFGLDSTSQQVMCMILYSEMADEQVIATLDRVGVAGFTELGKVTGRGPRGQHFDSHVWPGYDGVIYCVVDANLSERLVQALAELSQRMEQGSQGTRGLHVFTWGCQQRL